MAHHANLLVNQSFYELYSFVPALELDGFGAAFLHQEQRVSHRFVRASMKRTVGHVGNKERALHGAPHSFEMDQDFIEGNRHRIAIAQYNVTQTVSHQDDI